VRSPSGERQIVIDRSGDGRIRHESARAESAAAGSARAPAQAAIQHGLEIILDRAREESDVVLFELPDR
jgi:hypothetical protein